MTNLFGRGKEPFWQQPSTNLVKFVILLHEVLANYVTLFQLIAWKAPRNSRLITPISCGSRLGGRNRVRRRSRSVTSSAPLRYRSDRIIVGEVRGAEAFDFLQALNTGHAGTLSTIHANSAAEALARLASCALQSGVELPYQAVRQQIADAIQFVLHLSRTHGQRYVHELIRVGRYNGAHDCYEPETVFNHEHRRLGPEAVMTRVPAKTRGRVRPRAADAASLTHSGSRNADHGTTHRELGDTHGAALKLLRFPAVRERTGLSRSTVWRLERQGAFPRHHCISPNAVAWIEDDIATWIRSKVTGIAV